MEIAVVSQSNSYIKHVTEALNDYYVIHFSSLSGQTLSDHKNIDLIIFHADHYHGEALSIFDEILKISPSIKIGIASDLPSVDMLLNYAKQPVTAFCNSYMAAIHYRHMVNTIYDGHRWFAPQLLGEVLELAQKSHTAINRHHLNRLTQREREIAEAICEGMNNKTIAKELAITERTVKAHLSSIYQKLAVRDRLELSKLLLSS